VGVSSGGEAQGYAIIFTHKYGGWKWGASERSVASSLAHTAISGPALELTEVKRYHGGATRDSLPLFARASPVEIRRFLHASLSSQAVGISESPKWAPANCP
jgi:hypothetical protein